MSKNNYAIGNNMMSEGTSTPGGEEDSGLLSGLGNIFGGSKTPNSAIDLSKANGMMLQKDANGGYIVPTQFNDKIKSGEMVIGADGKLTDLTASAGTGILGTGMSAGDLASYSGLVMSVNDALVAEQLQDLADKELHIGVEDIKTYTNQSRIGSMMFNTDQFYEESIMNIGRPSFVPIGMREIAPIKYEI